MRWWRRTAARLREEPTGTRRALYERVTTIRSYRDLLVWQKAIDLAERCCVRTRRFPRHDQPVLGHQIRKSSVSMPSNIAEGYGRHSKGAYIQHLWIAHGSAAELETQLELGRRLGILSAEEAEALIRDAREVARMLLGLVRALDRTI